MAVITVNVGPKRVALTAYCPDDALGIAACEYVLARVAEIFRGGVTNAVFRAWLIQRDPEWAEVLAYLDAGGKLPKNPPWCVDPSNVAAERRIIVHLMRELAEQRGSNASGY